MTRTDIKLILENQVVIMRFLAAVHQDHASIHELLEQMQTTGEYLDDTAPGKICRAANLEETMKIAKRLRAKAEGR